YIGTLYYGKTERMASTTHPDKKTTWRRKPEEEWIAIAVPPIIDAALFAAAQDQREQNARLSRRNRKYEYLLAGHIQCGHCGCKMRGQCDVRYTRRYYRCTRPRYQMDNPCRGTVSATRLEQTVWDAVEEALRHPEIIAAEVTQRKDRLHTEQSD